MKRIVIVMLSLTLLLSGCTGSQPELPADWLPEWTVVSPLLAAEPVEGFVLQENNDALSSEGIYYATWSFGTAREHTNEDGEKAQAYDAQIYLILKKCRSEEKAAEETDAWKGLEKQNYTLGEPVSALCAGQEFTVLPLLQGKETNPYSHGAAAFAVRGSWAICVEFVCGESFAADPQAVLESFLSGLHYSE